MTVYKFLDFIIRNEELARLQHLSCKDNTYFQGLHDGFMRIRLIIEEVDNKVYSCVSRKKSEIIKTIEDEYKTYDKVYNKRKNLYYEGFLNALMTIKQLCYQIEF